MDLLKFFKYFIVFSFAFMLGKHKGYRDGAESEQFDRIHANMKLQQCLRIVRSEWTIRFREWNLEYKYILKELSNNESVV